MVNLQGSRTKLKHAIMQSSFIKGIIFFFYFMYQCYLCEAISLWLEFGNSSEGIQSKFKVY